MLPNSRLQLALWLCGGAGLLLSACQAAAPAATATTLAPASATQSAATRPAATQIVATPSAGATNTNAPSTPTVLPSDTATANPTATASPTLAPTDTPPPTATTQPTASPRPTRVPVTITPLGPPAPPSIYSTTSGPAGYSTSIQCERAGAPCAPVMPPGDVSFRLTLASDAAAPWTHFVNYGLSVQKDGLNVANMFMFVDAGWLQPGGVVGFGASRNVSQPGVYVIRSSGCLTTDTNTSACGWNTLAGDVVTFVVR